MGANASAGRASKVSVVVSLNRRKSPAESVANFATCNHSCRNAATGSMRNALSAGT
jgi:hypothetical protein